MRVDTTTIVGFTAGILTTAANIPQVVKSYRTRNADGLSFRMLVLLSTGLAMWTVYGLLSKSLPVYLMNAVGFILVLAIAVMKLRFDARPTKD